MIRIEKLTIPSLVGLYLSSARLSSTCARIMNELTCRASLVPRLLESQIKIKKLPNKENDTKEQTNQGWYSSTTVCWQSRYRALDAWKCTFEAYPSTCKLRLAYLIANKGLQYSYNRVYIVIPLLSAVSYSSRCIVIISHFQTRLHHRTKNSESTIVQVRVPRTDS